MQPALPSGRMLDTFNVMHAQSSSALTASALAAYPNKHTVGPTTRPGICQERWCHLWRSGFRHYLRPGFTFGDQLREREARHSRPLFETETSNLNDEEL